ncbi:MAG: hypothetical protein AAFX65_11755 [Cyanobacteria bacterium J06638_7]
MTPPYLAQAYSYSKRAIAPALRRNVPLPEDDLFDGNDSLFKELLKETRIYGEYGCGKSTLWVAENTDAMIRSAETALEWFERISAAVDSKSTKIRLEWIDLGPVEPWGYPKTYEKRHRIRDYLNSIWKNENEKPDTVLIDGRFRVACFLNSLLHARPGTRILFDDYTHRSRYHVVEEFIRPARVCGRQALFVVPTSLDIARAEGELNKFEYVME